MSPCREFGYIDRHKKECIVKRPPLSPNRKTCEECFWSHKAGPGPKVLRCVQSGMQRVEGSWPACILWEESMDCLDCAACCGPAFDAVEVSPRDPVRKLHPDILIKVDGRFCVQRREGNFCGQLQEKDNKCAIYKDRPRCCRDFTRGSANCLFARQRVGLSQFWTISSK